MIWKGWSLSFVFSLQIRLLWGFAFFCTSISKSIFFVTNFHTHSQHVTWIMATSCTESTLSPDQLFQSLSSPVTCTMQGCSSHIVAHMLSASSPTNLLLSGVWSSAGFSSHSLVYCSLILRNGPRWANHCRLRTFISSCSLYLCDYHTPVNHVLESKKYVIFFPPKECGIEHDSIPDRKRQLR